MPMLGMISCCAPIDILGFSVRTAWASTSRLVSISEEKRIAGRTGNPIIKRLMSAMITTNSVLTRASIIRVSLARRIAALGEVVDFIHDI